MLWDCVSLLDDAARARIGELGGIAAICMSHPHFYGVNVEYADAFDARIFIPRADQQWVQRPSPRIEFFDDDAEPVPGVTLARIGGHFDGAAVLHWPAGSAGRGALLTGDTITVVPDRDWVSFMWSYPNLIPLDEVTVLDIAERAGRFRFDRVYGGWWGRVVVHDGPAAIRRSAERYVARLHGERPLAERCQPSSAKPRGNWCSDSQPSSVTRTSSPVCTPARSSVVITLGWMTTVIPAWNVKSGACCRSSAARVSTGGRYPPP